MPQAWQPTAGSQLLVTGGKDGRVLVFNTSLYAEPDEEGIPKFAAPVAVAPDPVPDEVTALVRCHKDPTAAWTDNLQQCQALLNRLDC